jgi:hypothetical protein
MSGIRLDVAPLCASGSDLTSSTALTLSDTWLGVNALRLTPHAHVVHELKSLFPDEWEDVSRGKTGTKGS